MASLSVINKNPFWHYEVPEFELEGWWYINFIDENKNTIRSTSYFTTDMDYYVQSVTIPQLQLNYESNDFGFVSFKEKSAYDDVTITFCDDLKSSFKSFIVDWLHCVFDEDKHALKQNWRYEAKEIEVSNCRLLWGKPVITAKYQLMRCLPKNISEISMEEEAGSKKTYSVQLACQKVNDITDKIKIS